METALGIGCLVMAFMASFGLFIGGIGIMKMARVAARKARGEK